MFDAAVVSKRRRSFRRNDRRRDTIHQFDAIFQSKKRDRKRDTLTHFDMIFDSIAFSSSDEDTDDSLDKTKDSLITSMVDTLSIDRTVEASSFNETIENINIE
jgi:hypothetical protein